MSFRFARVKCLACNKILELTRKSEVITCGCPNKVELSTIQGFRTGQRFNNLGARDHNKVAFWDWENEIFKESPK